MYVYIKTESQLWTVGFYLPNGKWNPESDHDTRESASERVHYLNGGQDKVESPSSSYEEYQHFKKSHIIPE